MDSRKSVRKVPKSYRNVTGIHAAKKSTDAARYESTLERDFLTCLEFSPDVKYYTVQPVSLEWIDSNGKKRSYTPDMLVTHNALQGDESKPWLCEVKYRDDLRKNWPEYRPKFKAAVAFAAAQGWRFRIITDVEIRTEYMKNARFLLRYRHSIPDSVSIQLVLEQLKKSQVTTPSELIQTVFQDERKQAELLAVLWHLVATFQIRTELHEPLTMESSIW